MAPRKPNNSDWVVLGVIIALLGGVCCFIWQVGLPFISFVHPLFEETEAAPQPTTEQYFGCKKGKETKGYVCEQAGPYTMDDVSFHRGFYFIEPLRDDAGVVIGAHLADTCQHFFCGVRNGCMEKHNDVAFCALTTGCCLAHQVEPMTSSSARPPRP